MRHLLAASSLALAACGGTSVSMELQFPDPASRAETTGLQITAIEPFVAGSQDTGRSRVLLKCGQLGVFGPTAAVNRDQSDLQGINMLLNREGKPFPLEGDWTVDLDRFKSSDDTNPWRAVMVHVEARGPARKSEGGLSVADEAKTLLEGCFCMRLNENATLDADAKLDEEVKANCAPVVAGEPRQVVLKPVASEQFRLEPCGVQAVTAPRGRQAVALPGVCVRATPCNQDPTGNCFTCRSLQCMELSDLRNVPVRVTVKQAAGGAVADPPIILTNRFGTVVPQAQVDDCASPITVHAEVVGRVDTGVDFPVTCVDPIDFTPTPTDRVDVGGRLTSVNVAAIATIPEVRGAGGALVSPARVAVLLNGATDRTALEIYEADGGALVLSEELQLTDGNGRPERGLGLLGFHYDLANKSKPFLAVVTARTNDPVVRLFRYHEQRLPPVPPETTGRHLELVDITRQAKCPFDGCTTLNECGGDIDSRPCQRGLTLTQAMPPLPMAVADRNGDGLADFGFATDREFQLYTYYSSRSSPDQPPKLDGMCQCSAFGRGMPAYEMVSLGGPPLGFGAANTDLLMGDGTGAYVRYASEDRVEGPPCDPSSPDALACEPGLRCERLCTTQTATGSDPDRSSGRCVEPCRQSDPMACQTSPLRPRCMSITPGSDDGYCGGPGLACRSLNSVWRLTTIHDVAKGFINGDMTEDAIAVGAGSPVPTSGTGGAVRIMYGGALDLTKIDEMEQDVRNTSFVELTARRLSGTEDAQSPRGVETGDFNGDGITDIAAIYTSSEEIRVWLGGGNLVPGEIGQKPNTNTGGRVKLNECGETCPSRSRCFPFQRFAVADLDGNGKSEIIAVCVPDVDGPKPTLKWFAPELQ